MRPDHRLRDTLIALCLVLSCAAPALAVEVDGVDVAAVPVEERGPVARDEAFAMGLQEVLVKLTGNREAAAAAMQLEAFARPAGLVQQFSYATRPRLDDEGRTISQLYLDLRFDAAAIDRLLRGSGLPRWGRQRPATLLWIAVEEGTDRRLLAAGDGSELIETLRRVGSERGIPLRLPLMDLEDQRSLEVAEVWAGFEEPVLAASQRYAADETVIARVQELQPDVWISRWRDMGRAASATDSGWSAQGEDASSALAQGLELLADRQAQAYALVDGATGPGRVEIRVIGIQGVDDYGRTLAHLRDLAPVEAVEVMRAGAGEILFGLRHRGSRDQVVAAIALGRWLQPTSATDGPADPRTPTTSADPFAPPLLEYRVRR